MKIETIFSNIGICKVKIERRERQREELEILKPYIKSETYNKVNADILKDIEESKKELQKLESIIENHPHELQRKILYCRWVQGMTLQEIADTLTYSERYIARQHANAIKEINRKYQPDPSSETKIPNSLKCGNF